VDVEARSHDAAGNTTSIGSKTFTYDDANRISVANGRLNRAAAHPGNANLLRGGSKILGPLGAIVNYRSNYNKCQCPAK
jgi:hypothetical protein